MQCKDTPDKDILKFLVNLNGRWATWFDGYDHSVINCMPKGTTEKLALAKMSKLIKRGLVNGCNCGCRGDFVITEKGKEFLNDQ